MCVVAWLWVEGYKQTIIAKLGDFTEPIKPAGLTLPRGKLLRKAGVRFVCPKVKAGELVATLRRAPLYWAAIWALKARQFSG